MERQPFGLATKFNGLAIPSRLASFYKTALSSLSRRDTKE